MRLITLGRLALLWPSGEEYPTARHRSKLALLAVLALAEGPVSRSQLTELFWPAEHDERSRRHSLSNALSFLRGILGSEAISTHRTHVMLDRSALESDALELIEASRARNLARVVDLYTGTFLKGVTVRGSTAFESWLTDSRRTIDGAVARAAEVRCAATNMARDWTACTEAAVKWLEVDPTSADAARHLLDSLCAPGTTAARLAAMMAYDALVERLAVDCQRAPDPRVVALARRIQTEVAVENLKELDHRTEPLVASDAAPTETREGERTVDDVAGAAERTGIPSVVPLPLARARRRIWRPRAVTGALGLLALIIVARSGSGWPWLRGGAAIAHPVIAITDITGVQRDTTSNWLQSGMVQMLSTDLARYSNVEAIEPGRVRAVCVRAELCPGDILSDARALGLARLVGASLLVRGKLDVSPHSMVLGLTVRDVASGRVVRSFNVSASDPINLADQAASRLMDFAAASPAASARARFADVETSSPEAYQHFVRSQQAKAEGRFVESERELDGAVALDSGFGSALLLRLDGAVSDGDSGVAAALRRALPHARFTDQDLLTQLADSALHNGEYDRAELLARRLVARYPHDPRVYTTLGDVYSLHGKVALAESVFQRELTLDSLGDEAGAGPCVPCSAYDELSKMQLMWGQLTDAERTARRWTQLQPDLPEAWAELGAALAFQQRYPAAIDAERRAALLGGNDPVYAGQVARLLITARRFDAADSLIRSWTGAAQSEAMRDNFLDARALLQRERGQLRASLRTLDDDRLGQVSVFERMDALSRLGRYADAERLFRSSNFNAPVESSSPGGAPRPLLGDAARTFAWSRALKAEAISGGGDTASLKAIADSIRDISVRSYYGRDWRLFHHVLGRIAMQRADYASAAREFDAAQWGISGWTANLACKAQAELADHRPRAAIATLRRAYEGPLDAMGRYEPRSELDYLMATAFRASGQVDSAAVYRRYVADAWRNADPEIKRRLAELD